MLGVPQAVQAGDRMSSFAGIDIDTLSLPYQLSTAPVSRSLHNHHRRCAPDDSALHRSL